MPLDLSNVDDEAPPEAFEPPPVQNAKWPWKAAPVVANALDAATTAGAISRGGEEGNPLLRVMGEKNVPAIIAAKLGIGAAEAIAVHKLAQKRPKLAKLISIMLTAAPLYGAIKNSTFKPPPKP